MAPTPGPTAARSICILYGPDPNPVVETGPWLTGPTPLPPLWSLGYQQSRYSYYRQTSCAYLTSYAAAFRQSVATAFDIDTSVHWPFTRGRERFRPSCR